MATYDYGCCSRREQTCQRLKGSDRIVGAQIINNPHARETIHKVMHAMNNRRPVCAFDGLRHVYPTLTAG